MAALFSRIAGRLPKHGRDVAVELVLHRMGSCGWPVATTCNLAWAERGTRGGRWGAPARARCLWRTGTGAGPRASPALPCIGAPPCANALPAPPEWMVEARPRSGCAQPMRKLDYMAQD